MKRPEILAPAGNLEKLKMSVEYGADAVYFAGSQLGLRAGAQNFSKDDLKEAIDYCHQHGVKAYITVNIIAHDKHFEGIEEYIQFLESIHVDAIIVSDPGVLLKVKEYAPNAEIHLSTQANTTNYQTANFWHEIGADRIVLARELTLEEIKSVIQHKKDTLKIESFVHGAMCISYSGRCLLSSFMTNRHSNLGDCSHPCRWNYSVVEEKRPNEYYPVMEDENGTFIYNSKDLCMINNLQDLLESGIDSFKIEGRMKSSYYNATVVRSYKNALMELMEGKPFDPYWYEEIKKASHRDFTTGFYYGDPKEEGQLYTSSSYIREYDFIGLVKDYDPTIQMATVEQRNKFSIGDEIEIFGPDIRHFDYQIKEMYNSKDEPVESAPHPQEIIRVKIDQPIKPWYILRKKRV
ncbi:MAG: U32 family peptidase [Dethiosulfatibacter sp.]|nr:U32 family peptidase [Dethiosulfatibacter sp.]